VRQEPFIGSKGLMGLELCQRLFQHNDDCNGYFIAKLQNSGED
jgi:16S rRNA C967 or C1407 C5-methylase (RsmB/RsmF family)